ncbi:hypothetical protein M440DRAFT_135870 [Trichoderma longibrachiatum ATCC 18648]|uniref:Uncharacterized protein n=1 Tax=Trichoderma longibrachiatum ATCC 18648 TaxID=983965 RepID=A0A2T4BWF7_TRILO|nr:hypothetical protein M440DRAFT_135870 [Trichoderma longibrachiatum ATCC 18648]
MLWGIEQSQFASALAATLLTGPKGIRLPTVTAAMRRGRRKQLGPISGDWLFGNYLGMRSRFDAIILSSAAPWLMVESPVVSLRFGRDTCMLPGQALESPVLVPFAQAFGQLPDKRTPLMGPADLPWQSTKPLVSIKRPDGNKRHLPPLWSSELSRPRT